MNIWWQGRNDHTRLTDESVICFSSFPFGAQVFHALRLKVRARNVTTRTHGTRRLFTSNESNRAPHQPQSTDKIIYNRGFCRANITSNLGRARAVRNNQISWPLDDASCHSAQSVSWLRSTCRVRSVRARGRVIKSEIICESFLQTAKQEQTT